MDYLNGTELENADGNNQGIFLIKFYHDIVGVNHYENSE